MKVYLCDVCNNAYSKNLYNDGWVKLKGAYYHWGRDSLKQLGKEKNKKTLTICAVCQQKIIEYCRNIEQFRDEVTE